MSVHSIVKVRNSCLNVDPSNYRVLVHRTRIVVSRRCSTPRSSPRFYAIQSWWHNLKGVHDQPPFTRIYWLSRLRAPISIHSSSFWQRGNNDDSIWASDHDSTMRMVNVCRNNILFFFFPPSPLYFKYCLIELCEVSIIISQRSKAVFKAVSTCCGFCGLDLRTVDAWKVNICR